MLCDDLKGWAWGLGGKPKKEGIVAALVAQSCLTLCYPMSGSPPLWLQNLLSMGFSRQEYQSGLSLPSPGDLPNPGIEPRSSALLADFLLSELQGRCILCSDIQIIWKANLISMSHYHQAIVLTFEENTRGLL